MFEVGELVMINPALEVGEKYECWHVTSEMLEHKERVFEIHKKEHDNFGVYYRLNIPGMEAYGWTDEMLVPVAESEPASEDELKELFY